MEKRREIKIVQRELCHSEMELACHITVSLILFIYISLRLRNRGRGNREVEYLEAASVAQPTEEGL